MHTIQALILDLDDTLLDDRSATRKAFSAFFDAHRCALSDGSAEEALRRWRDISATHWMSFEQGRISFAEQRRARVRAFLGRSLGDADADAAFEPYRLVYESSWSPVADCREFLRRTAALAKVIVTNGDCDQQSRKVRSTGLLPHVRRIITPADCV